MRGRAEGIGDGGELAQVGNMWMFDGFGDIFVRWQTVTRGRSVESQIGYDEEEQANEEQEPPGRQSKHEGPAQKSVLDGHCGVEGKGSKERRLLRHGGHVSIGGGQRADIRRRP